MIHENETRSQAKSLSLLDPASYDLYTLILWDTSNLTSDHLHGPDGSDRNVGQSQNNLNYLEVTKMRGGKKAEFLIHGPANYELITGPAEKQLAQISDNSIDLTVTSPPYDNIRDYNGHTWGWDTFKRIARHLYRVTKPGGIVVWVVGDQTKNATESGTSFRQALYFKDNVGFKLHDTMIYRRNGPPQTHKRYEQAFEYMFVFVKGKIKTFNPIMVPKLYPEKRPRRKMWSRNPTNEHKMGQNRTDTTHRMEYNVWDIKAVHAASEKYAYQHPAIFPESLASRHIQSWSNPGDTVLDPFCGCGTTGKMALSLDRKFVGIEISAEYMELTRRRIADTRAI